MPSRKRVLLAAVVVSLVATAALAIGILLFSSFGETSGRILGTTFCISLASLLAFPGAALLDERRLVPLGTATLAFALVELGLGTAAIWSGTDTTGKIAGSGLAVTVATVQTAALAGRRRESDPRAVATLFALATAAVAILAVLVLVAIWSAPHGDYFRAVGAVAVVDVLVAILQPVLRRGAAPERARARVHRLRVTLDDGSTLEEERAGGDFADAAAHAIRDAERTGRRVRSLERLG